VSMVKADSEAVEETLRGAIFATGMGEVKAVTLPGGGTAYVQVTGVTPATTQPLAEIAERVTKDWQSLQQELGGQRQAEALLSAARAPATAGRSLGDAAQQAKVTATVRELTLAHDAEVPEWLRPAMLDLYALPNGAVLPRVLRDGDNWLVVQLRARTPALPLSAAEAETGARVYGGQLRSDVEALLIGYLQNTATITCHQEVLQQVFGRVVNCKQ
jgi:hypothetical protein